MKFKNWDTLTTGVQGSVIIWSSSSWIKSSNTDIVLCPRLESSYSITCGEYTDVNMAGTCVSRAGVLVNYGVAKKFPVVMLFRNWIYENSYAVTSTRFGIKVRTCSRYWNIRDIGTLKYYSLQVWFVLNYTLFRPGLVLCLANGVK